MNTDTKLPSHRVYAVTKKPGETKGFWQDIGACWPHGDGKGFKLRLNFLPLDRNAEIVIRERDENAEG